jgi:predicted transcriptional regulator
MAHQETRKQQIARRLGVSERVLEQYLQLKRAEVEEQEGQTDELGSVSPALEPRKERAAEGRVSEAPVADRRDQREKRV